MGKLIKKLFKSGRSKTKQAVDSAESKAMAAVGRRTVSTKKAAAKRIAKKAAKAGLKAGALTAAAVIVQEVRKPT